MPYLRVQTNATLESANRSELLASASALVASLLGKPEQYVMVEINDAIALSFAGTQEPCAYLELKSLSLPEQATPDLSRRLCEWVNTHLKVTSERVYIEFASPARHLWGWNSKTF